MFLSAHCHVLLALWDGKASDLLGGTAATIQFHHHDVMPGYTPRVTSSKLNLTEDESDLVYHIVCSRDRPDGEPAPGFKPFETSWFTTDEANPRTAEISARHRKVFEYTNEFSREAQNNAAVDRQGTLLAARRRAGGHAAGRSLGHQPGVLRGRLAGHPLPEEGREDAARRATWRPS